MSQIFSEVNSDFPADYTVIDIETTGLSCDKCEIIELSALKVRDYKVVEKFSTLVKPEGKINSFITSLTGISNDMVKDALPITSILPNFMQFISGDILLGHNVSFDLRFIKHNLKKYYNSDLANKSIDTMRISRKYCKMLSSHKLSSIANFYNVSTEGHHRALNDCMMTHQIYVNLKDDYAKN